MGIAADKIDIHCPEIGRRIAATPNGAFAQPIDMEARMADPVREALTSKGPRHRGFRPSPSRRRCRLRTAAAEAAAVAFDRGCPSHHVSLASKCDVQCPPAALSCIIFSASSRVKVLGF